MEICRNEIITRTLLGTYQTPDMLDAAIYIPETNIWIGLMNLYEGPSGYFAIIREGVIKDFEHRSETTDPPFEIGTDLELLDTHSLIPTIISTDPSSPYIVLEISEKKK
jgi:hypothetical protein